MAGSRFLRGVAGKVNCSWEYKEWQWCACLDDALLYYHNKLFLFEGRWEQVLFSFLPLGTAWPQSSGNSHARLPVQWSCPIYLIVLDHCLSVAFRAPCPFPCRLVFFLCNNSFKQLHRKTIRNLTFPPKLVMIPKLSSANDQPSRSANCWCVVRI